MPSERIQRRIDQLLDRAEAAWDAGDWTLAAELCRQVVTLDGENVDALPLLALAERGLSGAADSVPPASVPASPAPPPLPASFASGRYEVLGLLGEGGKKVVYRAHDSQLDRDVAFALIKTDGLNKDERERVTREARTLGRLSSHPNIVTVFEIGDEAGQPYLVTELMAGGDVAQRISESPDHRLPLPLVVQIGTAVCKALAFVHDKGVVHRDLKPGNIWLAERRRTKAWRLRAGRRTRSGPPDPGRDDGRHGAVHGAGTGDGADGHASLGPLQPRLRAVRAGHGPAAVRRRRAGGDHRPAPERQPGGALLVPPRLSQGTGDAHPPPAGEGPGEAPRLCR